MPADPPARDDTGDAGRDARPDGANGPDASASEEGEPARPVERLSAQDVYVAVRRAAEPLAILDPEGRFVFANDAFEALVRTEEGSDLHGRRWSSLLAPGEAERLERESRPSLRSGDAWRGRVALRGVPEQGDGEESPLPARRPGGLEISLTPLPDDRVLLGAGRVGPANPPRGRRAEEGREGHEPAEPLHDPVTGLAAPALFHELARRSLAAARREARTGAVLVVQLGLLSGEDAPSEPGDERRILQVAGGRLERALDEADAAGLLPGGRFAVAADDVDGEAEAVRLGRRLVEALEPGVPVGGVRRSALPAAGVALPSTGEASPEELIERASEAATAAVRERGLPVRVHRPGLGPTIPYRATLIDELRRALGRYALTLHHQPVVSLDAGEPAGWQILVRWSHPRHGLLEASRFVPLAREAGLVRRLDRWVLARAALEEGRVEDRSRDRSPLPVSVHLASETWSDPGLAGYVERALDDRPASASPLLLHLEADVARASLPEMRSVVAEVRDAGVGIAVEGIRADNASTSYLESLAPDLVCVERSLAAGAAADDTRLGVLRTLTDVAHTLGARVRAEGIERAAELAAVREAGCDEVRGHLVGWPAASRSLAANAFEVTKS